jgi:hypothetical protein
MVEPAPFEQVVDRALGGARLAVDVAHQERALLDVGDGGEQDQPDRGEREDAGDEASSQRRDHVRGGLSE